MSEVLSALEKQWRRVRDLQFYTVIKAGLVKRGGKEHASGKSRCPGPEVHTRRAASVAEAERARGEWSVGDEVRQKVGVQTMC